MVWNTMVVDGDWKWWVKEDRPGVRIDSAGIIADDLVEPWRVRSGYRTVCMYLLPGR